MTRTYSAALCVTIRFIDLAQVEKSSIKRFVFLGLGLVFHVRYLFGIAVRIASVVSFFLRRDVCVIVSIVAGITIIVSFRQWDYGLLIEQLEVQED